MEPAVEHARLLVVEDNADLGELMAQVLRNEGYEVRLAATLPQALAALDEQSFQLRGRANCAHRRAVARGAFPGPAGGERWVRR